MFKENIICCFATKTADFGEITQKMAITPFKVINLGTNGKPVCDFICATNHHHHHHHADIYNVSITTKQEHRCSTKIQIVVDETY